jgi:hypothetical protein
MGFFKEAGKFFKGTPEKHEQVSTLRPNQEPLQQQLINSGMSAGAGGAFGDAADYYRNTLNRDDDQYFDELAAPEQRRFNEDIIPGLSEQFAGMGSGGLDSSGFRNAAVGAGTDLSERLGAIRANLRMHGDNMRQNAAQGLNNIGQQGLQNRSQDVVTQQGTEGALSQLAPAIGTALGSFAGPLGVAAGGALGNWASGALKGKSSPYGNVNAAKSAQAGWSQ